MAQERILVAMKHQRDVNADKEWAQWVESVGGVTQATVKIIQALGCSGSKADKLACGRYQHELSTLEQRELVKVTKLDPEVISRLVGAKRDQAS